VRIAVQVCNGDGHARSCLNCLQARVHTCIHAESVGHWHYGACTHPVLRDTQLRTVQEGHLLPLSHSRLGLRRIRATHSWSDAFPITPVTHTPAEDGLRKWSRQCRQACPAERPTQTRTRRTRRTARDATKALSCIFHSHACICFPCPLRKARHVWKASLLGDPASVLRVESGSIHMHGCMSKAPAARPLHTHTCIWACLRVRACLDWESRKATVPRTPLSP